MAGMSGIRGVAAVLAIGCSACAPAGSQTPEEAAARLPIVKAAVDAQNREFGAAPAATPADVDTAYTFEFGGLSTPRIPMTAFRGDVVLVVNTASRCGYTPQYTGLQKLQDDYGGKGFSVIGVPSNDFGGQEPGSAAEIKSFCEMNFGVTFPMAAKSPVTGADAYPFYKWAEAELGKDARPGWNFHKLLVGKDGKLIAAFPSGVEPTSTRLVDAIEAALGG